MIFSITRYKRKEKLDIYDYKKFQEDTVKTKEFLLAIEILLGLSTVGIIRGLVYEV